ncbi:hypothetical protein KHC23_07735 [Ancylobacter dichloromethanicus]|uniref:Uncharacterized protein n=1 Tax=Ancylobacter dichloromethanicus TaxID=518825 RepID=A0A9W6MZX5_9HYPH|nr:hypothetical protein [Ancylobacter dichloromethanicus]MBS7553537.1 hypothetical protein [Ancylobacter dichloromethanicus]GLK72596.1 hypothetical protein GCM10017643_27120 [Ancylobacter dichloromethanicus]
MSDFLLPEREPGGLMDMSRLIAQADSMGWEWFERLAGAAQGDPKAIALAIARSGRLSEACGRLAENDDFKLLLEHLVGTTIVLAETPPPLGVAPDQFALYAAGRFRENALVWKILKLIAEGRKMPVGPAPTETQDVHEVSGTVGDGSAQRGSGRRRRRGGS